MERLAQSIISYLRLLTMEKNIISVDSELYENLRKYCDQNGIRFAAFIEDALESATQREEEMKIVADARDMMEQNEHERRRSYRRGFWQGFCAATFAGQGNMGLCIANTPPDLSPEYEKFKTVDGGQMELFEK